MDDPNDHSNKAPDTAATVAERSRFLSAIGFARPVADGGTTTAAAEMQEASSGIGVKTAVSSRDSDEPVALSAATSISGGSESVEELTQAAKAMATEVIDDAKAWPWRGADNAAVTGEGSQPRESSPFSPSGEARVEVKPFTPLDGPEEEEGIDAEASAEGDDGAPDSDQGMALLADLGPDFIASRDAMESLEDELLAGFDDDEGLFSGAVVGVKADPVPVHDTVVESTSIFDADLEAVSDAVAAVDPAAEPKTETDSVAASASIADEGKAVEVSPSAPVMPWLAPRKDPGWRPGFSSEFESAMREPAGGEAGMDSLEPVAPAVVDAEVEAETVSEDEPAKSPATATQVSGFSLDDFRSKLDRDSGPTESKPAFLWSEAQAEGIDAAMMPRPPIQLRKDLSEPMQAVEGGAASKELMTGSSPWGDFSWSPKPGAGSPGNGEAPLLGDDSLLVPDDDDLIDRGFGETLASMAGPTGSPTPAAPEQMVAMHAEAQPTAAPTAPAWSPPAEAAAPLASDPFAASVDGAVVDLFCPSCHRGLSLKKEHLGVAGNCVWCQTPIVAALSGATGRVEVFSIGSATEISTSGGGSAAGLEEPGSAGWPWGAEQTPAASTEPVADGAGFQSELEAKPAGGTASPEVSSWLNSAPAAITPPVPVSADPFSLPRAETEPAPVSVERPSAFEWNPAAASPFAGALETAASEMAANSGRPSPFEMGGSVEKLSEFLSHEPEPDKAVPLSSPTGLWAGPPSPFGGIGDSAGKADVSEVGPAGSPASVDLASLAGVERAAALSHTLWPANSDGPKESRDKPVAALEVTVAPIEAAPPTVETKIDPTEKPVAKQKPVKPKKAPKPSRDRTNKRGLGVKVFAIIAILGLIAGGVASAFFWKDIRNQVWPRLEPLVRKIGPSGDGSPAVADQEPSKNLPPVSADKPTMTAAAKERNAVPTPEIKQAKSAFDKTPLRIQDTPSSPVGAPE